MNWFFIAIAAPLLWAMANHIDKYVITRYRTNVGIKGLVTFTALFSVSLMPVAYLINSHVFNVPAFHCLVLMISGSLYIFAILFYCYALNEGETSAVMPMYQLVPVFAFFLGLIVLKEYLSLSQIIASLVIIAGATLISLDFSGTTPKFKKKLIIYLVVSAFLFALYDVMFKLIALDETFWISSFWQYLGMVITGIFFFSLKTFRSQFLQIFKLEQKGLIFWLSSTAEIVTIIGNLLVSYALLLAPVALVLLVESFQPLFVLVLGIIITIFAPEWVKENLSKKVLIQKITAIVIILLGGYLLYAF